MWLFGLSLGQSWAMLGHSLIIFGGLGGHLGILGSELRVFGLSFLFDCCNLNIVDFT